ncbi:unnamed protein product, partial [Phaeothamnion confervicola]
MVQRNASKAEEALVAKCPENAARFAALRAAHKAQKNNEERDRRRSVARGAVSRLRNLTGGDDGSGGNTRNGSAPAAAKSNGSGNGGTGTAAIIGAAGNSVASM